MASICCISDCHLGFRHLRARERLLDYEAAFNDALDKAAALKPGLLVLGGDVFHHTRPEPRSMQALVRRLMSFADVAPVVLCIGNHEIESTLGSSYSPVFSDIHENIHVLTSETPHLAFTVQGKEVGVHGFQYIRNKKTAEETLERISAEVSENGVNILCMHQAVEKYLEPHEISLASLREAAKKYDLILAGHVHRHQEIKELSDITPAYYIGSTEHVSFGEADNPTGFISFPGFDFSKPEFIPVKSAAMRSLKASLGAKTPAEINAFIETTLAENSDARCLRLEVEADIDGDFFDVRSDWQSGRAFTILDVSVIPKQQAAEAGLEGLELEGDFFDAYFEKTGLSKREDLKRLCEELYRRYG